MDPFQQHRGFSGSNGGFGVTPNEQGAAGAASQPPPGYAPPPPGYQPPPGYGPAPGYGPQPQPQVTVESVRPRVEDSEITLMLPSFPRIAKIVDRVAKMVPWYIWAAVGAFVVWRMTRRGWGFLGSAM